MLHRSCGDPLPSTLTPVLAPPLRWQRQGPCSARGSAYAWSWKWPALVPGPTALPIPALSVAVLHEERPGSPAHNVRRFVADPHQQITDNVVNMAAIAELISRAVKYNSVYFLIITRRFKEIAKSVIYLEGEGIHDLGAVERQGRNAFTHFVQKIIS